MDPNINEVCDCIEPKEVRDVCWLLGQHSAQCDKLQVLIRVDGVVFLILDEQYLNDRVTPAVLTNICSLKEIVEMP